MAKRPLEAEKVSYSDQWKLAQRAAKGESSARREVAELLYERVRTTIRYLSAGHRDRDDWVQLAMLEILSSLGGYRGTSSLKAWADRIAVRTGMRYLKRRRRREEKVALDKTPLVDGATMPKDSFEALMVRTRLAALLNEIEPRFRVALVLKLVHEYSVEEIADITQKPKETVKSRLKRGRKLLREKIGKDSLLMGWARKEEL